MVVAESHAAPAGHDEGSFNPDNYQLQLEEALALQSIYENDFRVVSALGLPPDTELEPEVLLSTPVPPDSSVTLLLQSLVHVELPAAGLQLRLPLNRTSEAGSCAGSSARCSSPGLRDDATGAEEQPTIAAGDPVAHLPPLSLLLHLPHGYPASCPPLPQLHALWLSLAQGQALGQALVRQWEEEEQAGGPVLFLWMEWLKQNALQHLGISTSITLQPYQAPAEQQQQQYGGARSDEGTASRGPGGAPGGASAPGLAPHMQPVEDVAMNLLRYAACCSQQAFQQASWRCPICFDDVLGARCVKLPDCAHVFCIDCFTTHCRTLATEGAVENIRCPEPSCRLQVPPHLLRSLLSEEEFMRWEALVLQRALDRMTDVAYCPRCQAICIEDKDHMGQCPACLYVFCSSCDMAWHPGQRCLNSAQILELRSSRASTMKLSAEDKARRQLDLANQMKSMMLVEQTTQQCPVCSAAIDKYEGCNKVVCANCSTMFCWRCKQVITGYTHFGADKCVLFNDEEVRRWNAQAAFLAPRAEQVEQRRLAAHIMMDGRHGNARPVHCPMCGQLNAKMGGNNNVRCWSCNNNFCALCRTGLKGKPGLHFGPSGCKQHTFD